MRILSFRGVLMPGLHNHFLTRRGFIRDTSEFGDVMQKYGFRGIKVPAMNLPKAEPRIYLTDRRIMEVFEKMEKPP